MQQTKTKREKGNPVAAILKAFAESAKPLNKYEVEKRASYKSGKKLAHQSVHDWIPRMLTLGWIRRLQTEKSSGKAKYYELTDLGFYRAGTTNPDMSEKMRKRLRGKWDEFDVRGRQNRELHIDSLLELVKQVLLSGKAAPGWHFNLHIATNKDGKINAHWRLGYR